MVLCPVLGKLLRKRVVLASASPRRREILSQAGLRFEVVPSRFKETLEKDSFPTPYAYAIETAKQKALEVAHRMHVKDLRTPDVVIGADTIVTVGGLILEKPVDKQDAYRMLSRLNGKEHSVFTGVAIVHCSSAGDWLETKVLEFHEETKVKFSELSEELIWEYIHSGEPMDKAGGYGIQALGGMLVERVSGDFLNVAGFPLNHFCKKLAELYCPLPHEAVRRVEHDSIPSVDTFEDLSNEEGSGQGKAGGDRTEAACNSTVETSPPFPTELLDLIKGFRRSKVLFTACKLKVFDTLKNGAVLTAEDVASKINASVCGTEQLLDACAALGLLERTERGYGNTELASLYLVSEGEHSLHGFVTHYNDHIWDLFTHLESAVQEGTNQFHRVSRRRADDSFKDSFYPSKEAQLQFTRAMHDLTKLGAHAVATAFDLSGFTSACDLGGCTGALAHRLVQEYPHLKVTVFDLPEIIELAPSFQPVGQQAARISFMPGDFFKDRLPEAELYILSGIIHDWPDDKVHQLLSKVSECCKPGGGLLVAEALLDEEQRTLRGAWVQSLNVLLQTPGCGRSGEEYRRLLMAHGFQDVRVVHTGGLLDAVLATR
ncbi:probable bifunctional dTTP/UTP pyrophosphatase/methyltransferase protein isoform X1 [Loxodonta africana]|uniref:probable bifunctional dTTP/UTP pyrophosphatase/methyltransferase protein isoform X1 n=2 Tax=Loxodonta africana TaxID=9785 RepID=UPI0030D6032B